MSQQVSTEEIVQVAKLAKLEIDADRADSYAKDISKILTMMDTLSSVDTNDIKPLSNVHDAYQVLRADVADTNIDRERNQSNAPAQQDGLFLVPRVVE